MANNGVSLTVFVGLFTLLVYWRVDKARKRGIRYKKDRVRSELELELYAHDLSPMYKGYSYFSDGRAWGVTDYRCINYETEQMEFYAPDGSMREAVNLPKGMEKILTDNGWLYSFNSYDEHRKWQDDNSELSRLFECYIKTDNGGDFYKAGTYAINKTEIELLKEAQRVEISANNKGEWFYRYHRK